MMTKWYSGTLGPKDSWHLSDRWGKTPKKSNPGNLSRPRIESGPATWQARMLPLVPQRWTLKIEWSAESKGSYRIYSIPSKTAALIPEFVVEDLPSAELQPRFRACTKGPALGQNTDFIYIYIYIYIYPNYFKRLLFFLFSTVSCYQLFHFFPYYFSLLYILISNSSRLVNTINYSRSY